MDALGREDLIRRIARRANLPEDLADKALRATIQALRESLIAGKRVVLPEFATLQVAHRKPQVLRDPETGHQHISGPAEYVRVTPDTQLRKHLDQTMPPAILLVAPKNDSLARVVEFHFSRVGWNVVVADTVAGCEGVLSNGCPQLCIIDCQLPDAQKLLQRIKSDRRTNRVPVIVLFPEEGDPKRADEFRVCGDVHLLKPFEVHALLMLAESELARSSHRQDDIQQQLCIQFPTTEQNLDTAGQFVTDLFASSGLADAERVATNAALREAMLNAAQHGNRYNHQKQIEVRYLLYGERVSAVVTDEGQGFDHSLYLRRSEAGDAISAARERYEQGRLGGLGIMLMVRCTDRLEYNQQGNVITLTKYL